MASVYTINQLKVEDDFLVHLSKENCPRFKEIVESGSNNVNIKDMVDNMLNFFSTLYYKKLSKKTGIEIKRDDHKKVRDICTAIYWMQQSNIELAFEMTEED